MTSLSADEQLAIDFLDRFDKQFYVYQLEQLLNVFTYGPVGVKVHPADPQHVAAGASPLPHVFVRASFSVPHFIGSPEEEGESIELNPVQYSVFDLGVSLVDVTTDRHEVWGTVTAIFRLTPTFLAELKSLPAVAVPLYVETLRDVTPPYVDWREKAW